MEVDLVVHLAEDLVVEEEINGTYFNADGIGYESVFGTTVNNMVIGELNLLAPNIKHLLA